MSELPINQIVCGDNCDVLRSFTNDCIDLVVTSPPYDDLRTYGGHEWDFYGVAWNLKRVLKPGGVIVWVIGDGVEEGSETGNSMRQALHFQQIGLNLHDTMIYEKHSFRFPDSIRYYQIWEYMFVFSLGRPRAYSPIEDRKVKFAGDSVHGTSIDKHGNRIPNDSAGRIYKDFGVRHNLWKYAGGKGCTTPDSFAFEHPAMFPEKLARDHILSWSNEGDIVLDPFSGSGTTAKMAKHNGRKYIGIEVNQEYCEIAEKRLQQQVLF